jgi:hypothetical protein
MAMQEEKENGVSTKATTQEDYKTEEVRAMKRAVTNVYTRGTFNP